MKIILSSLLPFILSIIVYVTTSSGNMHYFFGVVFPYSAFFIFMTGFIYKIIDWSSSPVPFNITTTTGQAESLKWIKQNKLESPAGTISVIGRMAMEILFFRSLFRNTKHYSNNETPGYGPEKSLWLFSLMFHYSFLFIAVRHLRFFIQPVPQIIQLLESFDGMLQVATPVLYLTDLALVIGVTILLARRVILPNIRYISLPADYIPLFIILFIALSGIVMRYITRVDIISIQAMTMGLVTFHPVIPANIDPLLFVHLFLVSFLFIYFPFSKLMHMGGIFFSPTRNIAANSRRVRHINPWNYDVKVHTYEEYEEDFKEMMKSAGLPVENDHSQENIK